MPPSFLRRVVIGTLLWLPACFALWYWAGHWLAEPAFEAARKILLSQLSNLIADIQLVGHEAIVTTRIHPFRHVGEATLLGPALSSHVDVLFYCYGQPLLAALLLATPGGKRARKLGLGLLALIPFQIWGIVFSTLHLLADLPGMRLFDKPGGTNWREVITACNHMGSLLFPSLAPIAIWLGLNRAAIWPSGEEPSPEPANPG